jgi:hypothetical protein
MADARIARLVEQEAIDGAAAYRSVDFLADVRRGIWGELAGGPVQIDPYRRNLQRAYLDVMGEKINGRQASAAEARSLARSELRSVDAAAARAMTSDRATRAHLQDVRDRIARILDPRFAAAQPTPQPLILPLPSDREGCWTDYAIRLVTTTVEGLENLPSDAIR